MTSIPRPADAVDFAVIPDLHGRDDALEALLRASGFVDRSGVPVQDESFHLVQLGDLIDRGPKPRACVDRMMELQARAPGRVHVLLGNHEAMALEADFDPMAKRLWLTNGGGTTLADYDDGFESLLQPGGRHYEWLKALPRFFEFKQVLFCHAGLGKARRGTLDDEGLLWDRPPLGVGPYRAVVCGHTPTRSGRIEEQRGVWCCDLGLGHHSEKSMQLLILSVSDQTVRGRVVDA